MRHSQLYLLSGTSPICGSSRMRNSSHWTSSVSPLVSTTQSARKRREDKEGRRGGDSHHKDTKTQRSRCRSVQRSECRSAAQRNQAIWGSRGGGTEGRSERLASGDQKSGVLASITCGPSAAVLHLCSLGQVRAKPPQLPYPQSRSLFLEGLPPAAPGTARGVAPEIDPGIRWIAVRRIVSGSPWSFILRTVPAAIR